MAIPSTPMLMLRKILYDFRHCRGIQVNENMAAASKSNFDPIVALWCRLITMGQKSHWVGSAGLWPFCFHNGCRFSYIHKHSGRETRPGVR
jgi:hypothetical protein